jgi:hypothetical protein
MIQWLFDETMLTWVVKRRTALPLAKQPKLESMDKIIVPLARFRNSKLFGFSSLIGIKVVYLG